MGKDQELYTYEKIIEESAKVLDTQIESKVKELQKTSDALVNLFNAEKDKKSDDDISNVMKLISSCVSFFKHMDNSKAYTIQEHERVLKINSVMQINLSIIHKKLASSMSLVKKLKSLMKKIVSKFYIKLWQLIKLSEITISGGTGAMMLGLVSANVGFTFKV